MFLLIWIREFAHDGFKQTVAGLSSVRPKPKRTFNEIRGYYFSKPLPVAEISEKFRVNAVPSQIEIAFERTDTSASNRIGSAVAS
jgi:hypothetical protein